MALSTLTVCVALMSLQGLSLVQGFSTGIGGCPAGPGAIFGVGSTHSGEPVDIATLDTIITLNDVIVNSADAGTVPVGTDITWSLDSTNVNGMKGILFRVEATNDAYTLTSPVLANEAVYCIGPGLKGVSHTESSPKTSVPGTMRFDEAGPVTVDLTVVFANGFDPATGASASITGYTQFSFVVEEAVAISPAPAVPGSTPAPVAVTTESPVVATTETPVAGSTEPPVDGATEPPTVTPVDTTEAPTIVSVDTESPSSTQGTEGPVESEEPVETEPPAGTKTPKGKGDEGGKGNTGEKGTKAPKVGKGTKEDDSGKGKGGSGKGGTDGKGKGEKEGKGKTGTDGEGKGKKEGKEKGGKGKGETEGKGKEAKVPKVGKSEKADKADSEKGEKEKGEKKQKSSVRHGRE